MNDWEQAQLAWEFAATVAPTLNQVDRTSVYAAIGAGDTYRVIEKLLHTSAVHRLHVPDEIVSMLARWLHAYQHSSDAPRLRYLVERLMQ